LPGYADGRALQLGLLDFQGTIEAARERFRINRRAQSAAGADDFSARIRERRGRRKAFYFADQKPRMVKRAWSAS